MDKPEQPRPWPDPDRPGNRLLSTYILGGLEIVGNVEIRSTGNTDISMNGNGKTSMDSSRNEENKGEDKK